MTNSDFARYKPPCFNTDFFFLRFKTLFSSSNPLSRAVPSFYHFDPAFFAPFLKCGFLSVWFVLSLRELTQFLVKLVLGIPFLGTLRENFGWSAEKGSIPR